MANDGSRQNPYEHKPLLKQGLLFRAFGRLPYRNAIIELNNELAAASSVRDVPLEAIFDLSEKYRIDIQKRCGSDLKKLYRDYIVFCLEDKKFSDDEADDLAHLQAMFGFSDTFHEQLYNEVALEEYNLTIDEVLADSNVTEEERKLLD